MVLLVKCGTRSPGFSHAETAAGFHWPLRINAFGILFLMWGLIALRSRIATLRLERQLAPPPEAAA